MNEDIKRIRRSGNQKVITISSRNKDFKIGDFVLVKKINLEEAIQSK